MKRSRWTVVDTIVYGLLLTAALYGPSLYAEVRGKGFGVGTGGVPDDDSVTANKMADGSHGAFTYASNTATLNASVVSPTMLATADFGIFSCLTGVCTIDRWAPSYLTLCPTGTDNAACRVFTNWSTEDTAGARYNRKITLGGNGVTQYRITGIWGLGTAVGFDFRVYCDANSTFGGGTTLLEVLNPTTSLEIDTGWLNLSAVGGACNPSSATDTYIMIGGLNGNGAEDPSLGSLLLAWR